MQRSMALSLQALASLCVLTSAITDITTSRTELDKLKISASPSSLVSLAASQVSEFTQKLISTTDFIESSFTMTTVSQCTATLTPDCSHENIYKTTTDIPLKETIPDYRGFRCPITLTTPCRGVLNRQSYTSMTPSQFDCRIIPTTATSIFYKTRPGPVEITVTFISQTKTPTVTNTVYTSCSPECTRVAAKDVTETITTARFTEYQVSMICDSPPSLFTDTTTLYTTQFLPVRNTDTVTITVTPEEPVSYFTSTYFVNTYADKVVEEVALDCVLPPPCKGFEATTVTETFTIDSTTAVDTICLDNWAFFQVTKTLTVYSCFNPFSIYACPDGDSCPMPTVITEISNIAETTVTLTEKVNEICYWQRPPVAVRPTMEVSTPLSHHLESNRVTVTVTVDRECSSTRPPTTTTNSWTATSSITQSSSEVFEESAETLNEISVLLEALTEEVTEMFPKNRMKVRFHAEIIERLTTARYHKSLKNLPHADLERLAARQKQMILSLRRYASDVERVKADPKTFFEQLEVLVTYLEKQPVDFRRRYREIP